MPVYHVSNFDVSAVQIDLSSNIFATDTLTADYWVGIEVNFNSNAAIKTDASLNALFKNVFDVSAADNVVNSQVYVNEGGGTQNFDPAIIDENRLIPNVLFKDLGVLNNGAYGSEVPYSNSIYTNVDALRTANNANTSFNGKVKAIFDAIPTITGLREKMLASINVGSDPDVDLGIEDEVPEGSIFGFKVIRHLNLAGTSEDRTIIIGVVLIQI